MLTANAAMRDGPWKLVRPQLESRPATAAAEAAMAAYVDRDIEYKYHPERVTGLLPADDPEQIFDPPPAAELYHIEDDPEEAHDLAPGDPDRVSRMLSELETWFETVEVDRRQVATQNLSDG